jgi:hypothetical protein
VHARLKFRIMLRFEGEKPSTATMTTKQVCERGGTAVGTRVTTTGIRFFAECRRLCRVLFIGHSAKKSLPSATLGKFRLSRQRYPLPSAEHSAQDALGNDTFAEGQTLGKGGSRQSAVSGRPPADFMCSSLRFLHIMSHNFLQTF